MSNVEQMEPQKGGAAEAESPMGGAQVSGMAQSIARKAASARKAAATAGHAAGDKANAESEEAEHEEEASHHGHEVAADKGRPADVAQRGFTGSGQPLPFRSELERSFGGVDFSGVRIHTDEKAQAACKALNAHAYAMGSHIAFADASPDKKLLAHELTHVIQQGGAKGGAKKSAGVDNGEIETAGEHEAEQVEANVGEGKQAKDGLQGKKQADPEAGHEQQAGHEQAEQESSEGEASGPARKKGPALDSRFTMGMSFSPTSMEKSYEYTLWDREVPPIPIAAVPGLFFTIEPSVKVKAAGGVDWKDKNLKTNVGVEGGLLIGFTYGNKDLAALYGGIEGKVSGGFEYSKSNDSWKLEGGIKLGSNFTIGCKVAGGILDYKFDFGKVDPICTFGGLKWEKGKPFESGWFSWGEQVQQFFGMVKNTVQKAKELLAMGAEAARNAYNAAANTAKAAYRAGGDFVNWVSSW